MDIISLQFALFAFITICVYHIVPDSLKRYVLLFSSIYFYLQFGWNFLWVILLLGNINYALAFLFMRANKEKIIPIIAIGINLLAFGFLKVLTSRYSAQLMEGTQIFQNAWLMPVGFSFYLLQLISFQVDLRNGRFSGLPTPLDFSIYLMYFPKLLSGPIEKPKVFFEHLAAPKLVDNAAISRGMGLILTGLIRKLLIANLLVSVMPNWTDANVPITWFHVLGYVLLVYNDFAGYTAVVRGVSTFFGIELSPNFLQPLLSRNFSEFWTRWHITLSNWLKETIFFPLARKLARNSGSFLAVAIAIILPPLATMLASGFWHGASLALILWGGMQGILLIIERLLYERWPNLRPQSLAAGWQIFSMGLVFVVFSVTMVPFAVGSVKPTLAIWSKLISKTSIDINTASISVIFLGCFSFLLDILSSRYKSEIWWEKIPVIPRSAVVASSLILLCIAIAINLQSPNSVFIYQGF